MLYAEKKIHIKLKVIRSKYFVLPLPLNTLYILPRQYKYQLKFVNFYFFYSEYRLLKYLHG